MTKRIYNYHNIDIINAYRTLFNVTHLISSDILNTLDLELLKNTYRDRVKKNHPDRSKILGINEMVLSERFKEINIAYDKLTSYVENKKFFRFYAYRTSKKTEQTNRYNAYTYSGPESNFKKKPRYNDPHEKDKKEKQKSSKNYSISLYPEVELPLGQYLYYSGVISLHDLIQSIIWQRRQRPLYGCIAREMNLLKNDEISIITNGKKRNEKFGECALRLGFINSFQHKAILGKQRKAQIPIGRYFMENRLIDRTTLDYHLTRQSKHNRHIREKNGLWKNRK